MRGAKTGAFAAKFGSGFELLSHYWLHLGACICIFLSSWPSGSSMPSRPAPAAQYRHYRFWISKPVTSFVIEYHLKTLIVALKTFCVRTWRNIKVWTWHVSTTTMLHNFSALLRNMRLQSGCVFQVHDEFFIRKLQFVCGRFRLNKHVEQLVLQMAHQFTW